MAARTALGALIGLLMAALLLGAPATAHQSHAAKQAVAQPASPAASAAAPAASDADVPVTDMAWPSSMNDGMMMNHPKEPPKTFQARLIAWLGMWHPAVIHLPIGLLLTVAFLELAAAIRRKPLYAASNKILLAVATIGAFVAAPLGWADAGMFNPAETWALPWHRWIGTGIPFLLLLLWWLKRPAEQAAVRLSSRAYEALLVISVAVILVQAYLGGEITHGANHMAF